MTLRPTLSDSLPLSTFEDAYSIFKDTCFYLFYSLKEEILDINLWLYKIKKPFDKCSKGLIIIRLPRQDDFRNFYMRDETKKVHHEFEEVVGIS